MEEEIKTSKTRARPGRKGFDIDYVEIAKIYIETGESLESLATRFGVSKWTLLARFKKLGAQKTIRRYQDDLAFSKFTELSCYWAGFLAADGCVSKYNVSLELSMVDKAHLEKIVSFIKGNTKLMSRKKICFGKEREFCSIQINSKQIRLDLEKNFNVVSNKSLTYEPPAQIPERLIRHFVRGYVDGDGSIGEHNGQIRINVCSGSEKLLQWISDNIRTYNSEASNPKVAKRKDSNLYTLEFNGKQTNKILGWLYSDSEVYLDRKYKRYMEHFSK